MALDMLDRVAACSLILLVAGCSNAGLDTTATTSIGTAQGDCEAVVEIALSDDARQAIERQVVAGGAQEVPPLAEVYAHQLGQSWLVVQASFAHSLEPAIFVIRDGQVVGMWTGQAGSAAEIRAALEPFLADDGPGDMLACVPIAPWFTP